MRFVAVTSKDAASLSLDGVALGKLNGDALSARASILGIPRLSDDLKTQLLIGVMIAATEGKLHKGTFSELRDEARGLLLLSIRREGQLSANSAEAVNVLNKGAVVEKYRRLGNRWTMAPEAKDDAVEKARKELGGPDVPNTAEWLRELADALDEPVEERPFWKSKAVLFVLFLAGLFILVHVVLLVRVLHKVHVADSNVLFYPIAGLSVSALVGAFAIGVNTLSEPKKKPKPSSSTK